MLEINQKEFGPHIYFPHLTFDELQKTSQDRMKALEDGSILITMEHHQVRCWADKTEALERVVIQSRFHIEADTGEPIPLTRFLMVEFHMSKARAEALRLRSALRSKGIKCRVMPVPVGERADTQLR